MGSVDETLPPLLASLKTVDFPDGTSYELLEPITSFRHCHDGSPREARIVYRCKRSKVESAQGDDEEFIMKLKVQADGPGCEPQKGPSTTTAAEIKALKIFANADSPVTPHLVAYKSDVQGAEGLLPGGYLNFLVMTKMPGKALFDVRYVDFSKEQKDEISQVFLQALKAVHDLHIDPIDRGLRNVLWDSGMRKCSIIDFELWDEISAPPTFGDMQQLERWGLARTPVAKGHWEAWNLMGR